jgi:hypothetical protein
VRSDSAYSSNGAASVRNFWSQMNAWSFIIVI